MIVRQSDLKTWQKCPLQYYFAHIEGLPRLQSGSLTFGSILHHCIEVMEVQRSLDVALAEFERLWRTPTLLGAEYAIEYYVRGTSWRAYAERGPELLRNWWSIIEWDSDTVLAREHTFDVPIGDGHLLHGTIDKLSVRYVPKLNSDVVLIGDYKTDRKQPKYDFLEEDLQFTAYGYATTQDEFWDGLPNGQNLRDRYGHLPVRGEWVQLTGPKRMDAGPRYERHYRRLQTAVDNLALSVAMRIFVPNISGESCAYCDFRGPCGLPEREDD